MVFESLKGWTPAQRHAVAASFLGWSLDAFDYFVLVFVLSDVAGAFHASLPAVAVALMLTLARRPVGAVFFGRLADRYGRKPIFMINILLYSAFGFASGLAPSLTIFLIIRTLFGVAMGGIWGVGASLAMETVPPKSRGIVSGLLQSGYPTGYLIASLVYGLIFAFVGWRGFFMIGIIPALFLVLYIWRAVVESPGWSMERAKASSTFTVLKNHWRIALFAIVLMTAFNFFSHGTQDIYPTFLQVQHGFSKDTVSIIAVIYNIGAIMGGLFFGIISQRIGRRRAIITASLLAVPVAALWAFSSTAIMLGLGAFLMQFFVQGAWGVVPAHLNELSPADARGTFGGTVYQLGNFIASINAVLQTTVAAHSGGHYGVALAAVAVCAGLVIAVMTYFGPEARHIVMAKHPIPTD
jgi:SHS family lactate transporter-like MFS transporter